jgi:hypothetical protein
MNSSCVNNHNTTRFKQRRHNSQLRRNINEIFHRLTDPHCFNHLPTNRCLSKSKNCMNGSTIKNIRLLHARAHATPIKHAACIALKEINVWNVPIFMILNH